MPRLACHCSLPPLAPRTLAGCWCMSRSSAASVWSRCRTLAPFLSRPSHRSLRHAIAGGCGSVCPSRRTHGPPHCCRLPAARRFWPPGPPARYRSR
uniref:Putative secreted peptide n=1 Tax=Anopheles braziliensis TaxID=58242 RepID=A0A2M3ZVR7_9DIPT